MQVLGNHLSLTGPSSNTILVSLISLFLNREDERSRDGERRVMQRKRVLRVYEQRKYVHKTEKRRAHRCATKQLGLLTTGKDLHLLTRERIVLTVCTPK